MSRNHDNHVRGDRRAIEARRASAEGRAPRRVVEEPTWQWITEKSELQQACLEILRGVPKLYPIFGIQLFVEERSAGNDKFAALVYHDALYGADGQNLCGNLRSGFWIGVKELLGNPARKEFRSPQHELLTLTLLAQPEMQTALSLFKQEEEDARIQAEQERVKLLANLRNKVFGTVDNPAAKKPSAATPVMLASISDLLTCSEGVLEYDGLTLVIGPGPQDSVVVRVKNAPEGHPMVEMTRNIFARQNDLFFSADRHTAPEGMSRNAKLAVTLRTYLRAALIAAGQTLLPPPEDEQVRPNGNGAHTAPDGASVGKGRGVEVSSAS